LFGNLKLTKYILDSTMPEGVAIFVFDTANNPNCLAILGVIKEHEAPVSHNAMLFTSLLLSNSD
jgi:hypothetical protein